MPRGRDRRVLRVTGEPGEWFVDLTAGFAFRDAGTDGAQHGFGEDTRAAISRSLREVVPCACAECLRLIAAGRAE